MDLIYTINLNQRGRFNGIHVCCELLLHLLTQCHWSASMVVAIATAVIAITICKNKKNYNSGPSIFYIFYIFYILPCMSKTPTMYKTKIYAVL